MWHADALGLYSGTPSRAASAACLTETAVGKQYLSGTQITDPNGTSSSARSSRAGLGGRTPHVHFKIFLMRNEVVASQIFFPDEINKEVFAQWHPYRQHASKRNIFNTTTRSNRACFPKLPGSVVPTRPRPCSSWNADSRKHRRALADRTSPDYCQAE